MSRVDEEIAANELALNEARVELLRTALSDGGDLLAHHDTILGLIGNFTDLTALRLRVEELEDEIEDMEHDDADL